jgi:integration host factor subunit beta
MLKSELIQRIAAQHPHLYQRDVEKIVNIILDRIVDAMASGDRVELRDFGTFSARVRGDRVGRNPRTGEAVTIDRKALPYFKPGREIRKRLNRKPTAEGAAVEGFTDPRGCVKNGATEGADASSD